MSHIAPGLPGAGMVVGPASRAGPVPLGSRHLPTNWELYVGASIMKRRSGFTLVELMVSMALIIFMMAILSQAFMAALGVFRNLKGQGDLAEKLRATAQMLQHDLAANHFESNRRLSDPSFWSNGPPQQGFFQILQGSASLLPPLPSPIPLTTASYTEGYDLDVLVPPLGIPSYLTTNHALSFTVRLAGNNMGDFMSASATGSGLGSPLLLNSIQTFGPLEARYQLTSGAAANLPYNSQWAAVAWFLQPQINPTTLLQERTAPDPTAASLGTPLYTLYRRQCLLVPDNNLVTLASGGTGVLSSFLNNYLEISCLPDPNKGSLAINFNSPRDITMPANRGTTATSSLTPAVFSGWGGQTNYTPISANPAAPISLIGSDIQMNDVVSFDVRVLPLYPVGTTPPNPADPFVTLWDSPFVTPTNIFTYTSPIAGATYRVFDTWSSYSNGINDYSQWNNLINPTPGTTIPFWTTSPVIYQYPVGSGQTITLPGANNLFPGFNTFQGVGSGPIIRAIQVTIRIWDYKTNQTRQVTLVQAM
jgi:prepilin-type N-terminal cleavage/methylation domain-containing protein